MKPMGFSPCGNALEKIAGTEGYGLQPLHKLLRTLRALYAAKKLHFSGFVTGHDFSRADKPIKPMGFSPCGNALEKMAGTEGYGLQPVHKLLKIPRALAPVGRFSGKACIAILLALALLTACRKEEQVVVGVAQTAVNAQHKALETATNLDRQRTALAAIPLPTKSLYIDVHEPGVWANPFLSVDADTLNLRVTMADANPSDVGQGTMLRPAAARRQELQLRPADLAQALIALPPAAWPYGRVIAVAESPLANRKDRAKLRRNVEAVIRNLNDLGLVVDEWPAR